MAAAKAEFFKKYEEAAAAAAAAPAEEAEEKAVESRKKRQILMPYSMAPLVAKATVKTAHFEKDDAALTPASTTKIELKEQEHDVYTPLGYPFFGSQVALLGRKKRQILTPYSIAPLVAKATVKTSHFEKDDAALTPASTTKIELKEQEHDVYTPFSYPMYQPLYLLRGDRHNCVHNCWRNADLHPYVEFKSVFDFFLSIQYGKKQVHYK